MGRDVPGAPVRVRGGSGGPALPRTVGSKIRARTCISRSPWNASKVDRAVPARYFSAKTAIGPPARSDQRNQPQCLSGTTFYGKRSTPKRFAINAVITKQAKVSRAHQSKDHQKPTPLFSSHGRSRNIGKVGMTYQKV